MGARRSVIIRKAGRSRGLTEVHGSSDSVSHILPHLSVDQRELCLVYLPRR